MPPQITLVEAPVVNVQLGVVLVPVALPTFAPTPLFAPVYSLIAMAQPLPSVVSENVATTSAVVLVGLSSVHISTRI